MCVLYSTSESVCLLKHREEISMVIEKMYTMFCFTLLSVAFVVVTSCGKPDTEIRLHEAFKKILTETKVSLCSDGLNVEDRYSSLGAERRMLNATIENDKERNYAIEKIAQKFENECPLNKKITWKDKKILWIGNPVMVDIKSQSLDDALVNEGLVIEFGNDKFYIY